MPTKGLYQNTNQGSLYRGRIKIFIGEILYGKKYFPGRRCNVKTVMGDYAKGLYQKYHQGKVQKERGGCVKITIEEST